MRSMSTPSLGKRCQGNLNIGKERGVVAVLVALSIVVLVGFVGLALDLGKLFVTKSELQNSADACALAAARELTGASTNQLTLAEAAGIAAGIRNNVQFQNDPVTVNADDVTFSDQLDGAYLTKDAIASALTMKFARCTVERTGIANWFVQVLGIGDQQVAATAVATLWPGQTTCGLPVTVCESVIATKSPGDWIAGLLGPGDGMTGNFMWANFEAQGTKTLKDTLAGNGQCNLPAIGTQLGDTGIRAGAYSAWNTRFGVYQGDYKDYQDGTPDYTGASYTGKSWSQCKNAFSDFVAKRATNTPYPGPKDDGLKVAPPANTISSNDHLAHGADRRLVVLPVVDCTVYTTAKQAPVKDWACVLMLHPLDQNPGNDSQCPTLSAALGNKDRSLLSHFLAMMNPINSAFAAKGGGSGGGGTSKFAYLEYLGLASDPDSPCASIGSVGAQDSAGPLVPALVQ